MILTLVIYICSLKNKESYKCAEYIKKVLQNKAACTVGLGYF